MVISSARSTRATARAVIVVALALVALGALTTAAFADTTFTNAQPVSVANNVRLDSVVVQVHAYDPAQLRSATVLIDGVSHAAGLSFDGYWDGDGCDTWFVADPTNATVSYRLPSVAVGSHDVVVRVTNGSGQTKSYSWSLAVAPADLTFSGATPGPGSTVTVWNPDVSLSLVDPAGPADGPSIVLDGATHAVPMLWGDQHLSMDEWNDIIYNALPWEVPDVDWSKGFVTFKPASLSDGTHHVTVNVSNNTQRKGTHSWSFTVAAPPQIAARVPADGSSVSTLAPVISARVEDNGTIESMKMLVDGAEVGAVYDASSKKLSYTPSGLDNDRQHTVRIEATDAGGLTATSEWKFTVQVYEDMPVSSVCESCHDVSKHPMQNCDKCHGYVAGVGHGLPYQPVSRCTQCHHVYSHSPAQITPGVTWGGADDPQPGYTGYWGQYCTYCHAAAYPAIPRHPNDNAAFHNTAADVSSCAPCHVTSLTREHYRYAPDGKRLDCDTCHGPNAPAKVKTAVASGITRCDACHEFAAGGDAHESLHKPDGLDDKCLNCHKDSLTAEHMNNLATQSKALSCGTCHSSTDGRVVWAIFAGDKSCSACHITAHALGLAPSPTGVPRYAGFRWSTPIDSSLFAGESWLPQGSSGSLILSDRRTDVTLAQVWAFYNTELPAVGWTLASGAPAEGDTSFKATFTKGARTIVVWFYRSETPAGGAAVSTGSRIEILYR